MHPDPRVPTGLAGLDEILNGGFLPHNAHLVRGGPGTGKTTFGMHFLSHGARQGEKALYITLGESEEDLRRNAGYMGIDLEKVHFVDESPRQDLEQKPSRTAFSIPATWNSTPTGVRRREDPPA